MRMPLKTEEIDKLVKEEQYLIKELDKMKDSPEKDEKMSLLGEKRDERLKKSYELMRKMREQERDESEVVTPKSVWTYSQLRKILKEKYDFRIQIRRKVDELLNDIREDLKRGREISENLKGKSKGQPIDKKDKNLKKEVMEW